MFVFKPPVSFTIKLLAKLHLLNRFRHRLTHIDALPQLTLLGIVIGFAAGLLLLAFTSIISLSLNYLLPQHSENFEGLSPLTHFLAPVIGASIIAIGLYWVAPKYHHVSVSHVLERLHNFQGRLPLPNLLVQFFGGIISLVSGQSVGREGPAVHLGAGIASLIGQWLRLPNNSLSTLVGCGVAAAISASFNTPIAGVIFAMEVVLVRYTITGFIPIMMASVCGSLVTRSTLGIENWFSITATHANNLAEIPYLMLAGLVIALFASAYLFLQLRFGRMTKIPLPLGLLAAGLLTGSLGIVFPQILGLGYDTINLSIEGKLSILILLGIAMAKILATSFSIGMGVPGGLIGPQLVIGACLGGAIGTLGNQLFDGVISETSVYVLLGMAGMMGAVLNAPLAALTAVVELTYNPSIIFPGMLVIVVSCVTTRFITKREGIFVEQLKLGGTQLTLNPLQQLLSDIGVRSAMNTSFVESQSTLSPIAARHLLASNPLWVVIHQPGAPLLLRASDLAAACKAHEEANTNEDIKIIDLLEIPAQRYNLATINELASLWEAKQILDKEPGWALAVIPQIQTTPKHQLQGIVTNDTINHYYQ